MHFSFSYGSNNLSDILSLLIRDFVQNSQSLIEIMLKEVSESHRNRKGDFAFYMMEKGKRKELRLSSDHFFLRVSTEYSNPQVTLEEIQGIVAVRLLETCLNYLEGRGLKDLDRDSLSEVSESLKKPPKGKILPFLLNTDDVEPDRYSINPLRNSILESGQSAFPSASVTTEDLETDQRFVAKYKGSLISKDELDSIESHLKASTGSYVDFVDRVKCEELRKYEESFGIKLCLPMLRMPLEALRNEAPKGALHQIIRESHSNFDAIKTIYTSMGRNIKKKSLLLTVPHSGMGFGSKKSARGRLVFNDTLLDYISMKYKTVLLYPNMIDPNDVSIAVADDKFSVKKEQIAKYDYSQTPSSPQFALYCLLSPEDASLWHGVGKYAGSEVVKSFVSVKSAQLSGKILRNVSSIFMGKPKVPVQLNLVPAKMWVHPKYNNIDASVGCIEQVEGLVKTGMSLEVLDAKSRSIFD